MKTYKSLKCANNKIKKLTRDYNMLYEKYLIEIDANTKTLKRIDTLKYMNEYFKSRITHYDEVIESLKKAIL